MNVTVDSKLKTTPVVRLQRPNKKLVYFVYIYYQGPSSIVLCC